MFDIYALYAQPESTEDFDRHYRQVHLPKVMAMPHILEVTWGKVETTEPGAPYLIARLVYASAEDAAASQASPEGRVALEDLGAFAGAGVQAFNVSRLDGSASTARA